MQHARELLSLIGVLTLSPEKRPAAQDVNAYILVLPPKYLLLVEDPHLVPTLSYRNEQLRQELEELRSAKDSSEDQLRVEAKCVGIGEIRSTSHVSNL